MEPSVFGMKSTRLCILWWPNVSGQGGYHLQHLLSEHRSESPYIGVSNNWSFLVAKTFSMGKFRSQHRVLIKGLWDMVSKVSHHHSIWHSWSEVSSSMEAKHSIHEIIPHGWPKKWAVDCSIIGYGVGMSRLSYPFFLLAVHVQLPPSHICPCVILSSSHIILFVLLRRIVILPLSL
jgi:hypothetical protein